MPGIGCELNARDPCVVNKIINAKQRALLLRADDVKASHVDPKFNGKFAEWAELTRRSDELGHVKVHRGKKDDCPGMTIDYSTRGAFKVDTKYHINAMKEAFPCKTNKTLKA